MFGKQLNLLPSQLRSKINRRVELFSAAAPVFKAPMFNTDWQCKCGGLSSRTATVAFIVYMYLCVCVQFILSLFKFFLIPFTQLHLHFWSLLQVVFLYGTWWKENIRFYLITIIVKTEFIFRFSCNTSAFHKVSLDATPDAFDHCSSLASAFYLTTLLGPSVTMSGPNKRPEWVPGFRHMRMNTSNYSESHKPSYRMI